MDAHPAIPIGGVALSVLCLWASLRLRGRQRLLSDLPTSKVDGVFVGLVELKGTAETPDPLRSFLAESPCVHYAYSVEEEWSRTVVETETDSDGKTRTRTRTESGWKTVAEGGETEEFYLRDDTGVILVNPAGAKLEPTEVVDCIVGRGDALYYGKGPADSVADSQHRRRFVERAIPLHAPLYLVGTARERPDVVAPMISAANGSALYLISTRTEAQVQRGQGFGSWALWLLGLLLAGVLPVTLDRTSPAPIALTAGAFIGVWALCWIWMVYNSLVSLRNRVRQGWSLIDVQLKRRHDLIPSLVTIVAALSQHEGTVQTAVATLRAQLSATPPGKPGADPEGVTATLRGVVEKYPTLVAQPAFAELQRSLVQTEQRIALARTYYNDIATQFATRLERVPDRWVAALGRMQPELLLATASFERASLKVDFASTSKK